METTQVKRALLDLIEQARAEQQAWIDELTDAERAARGTAEQWAPKDEIAHVTFWQQRTAARLAAARRGEDLASSDDWRRVNEETFEERRGLTWEQVRADAERAYAALADEVRATDEALLSDPHRFASTNGQPLSGNVVGNGFWHPLEHVARYYANRGEMERATELLERSVVSSEALGALASDRGAALYNMACFYATAGQPDKALPLLPESFQLRPDLVEWSKQDSDLDSLREMAAFQALHAS